MQALSLIVVRVLRTVLEDVFGLGGGGAGGGSAESGAQ